MTNKDRARDAAFQLGPVIKKIFMVFGVVISPYLAHAFGNDSHGCAADEPCFQGTYQSGDKVVFEFNGVRGFDFYNVRYTKVGGGEKQVENRSGVFRINNVRPRRVYTLKVQGCRSRALRSSVCSDWVEASVTTR